LASNGTNCDAGKYPLGVDAAGNVEGCTTLDTSLNTYLTTNNYTTGAGTSGYIAKWSDNNTLTTSSILSEVAGSKVQLGGNFSIGGWLNFANTDPASIMVNSKNRISISNTDTTGITFFKQNGSSEFFKVKTVGSAIRMSVGDGGSSSELDVGTVDPLYTIDGKRYATYMSGMTGVKEETSGVLTLDKNSAGLFMAKLDFAQSPEGSDLWLFGRTTDIINNQEHFNKVSCLLTSNFSGEVWYEKDWESKAITIFARPANSKREGVEVSYRLTAPRFDNDSWNNYSNSDNEGFNLDQLLQ
jgi:hypothetical protein